MIIYGLTIALQLAGALLLMYNFWGNIEERTLREYFPGSNIAKRNDKNEVRLEKERLVKCASNIYLTRISFIYIVLGYMFNIFGNNNVKPCLMFSLIGGFTAVFSIIAFGIATGLAKIKYKTDEYVDYSTLATEMDVDTVALPSEIEAMFKK